MNFYDDALIAFCSKDPLRKALMTPFSRGTGYVYATNGYEILSVPEEMVVNAPWKNEGKDVSHIWAQFNGLVKKYTVAVEAIKKAYKDQPLTPVIEYDECPECGGSGVITCESCGHEEDCEECYGDGVVNRRESGRYEPKDECRMEIAGIRFHWERIRALLRALDVNPCDRVEVIVPHNADYELPPVMFRFLGVEVILMPIRNSELDIVATLPLLEETAA